MKKNPKVVSFDCSSAYAHHRAMVNRRENNPIDALELMRHAVESAPENREYRLDLAEMYCEMGCHEQSNRLLLDMLAQDDPPAECFYGLALNQLGMNDLEGARRSLKRYSFADPEGAQTYDVSRLAAELDFFNEMNRPVDRRLRRAMRIADHACDALRENDAERAVRLFERSLGMASEQFEMRALYAMALIQLDRRDEALEQARRAAEGYPPSARAMCVASQVYCELGYTDQAKTLLRRVLEQRPEGGEVQMLLYALSELDMHDEIAECARLALQETPFDRRLLHIRAVAMYYQGKPDAQARHFWLRILRIDPDDTVAEYYQEAAARGELCLVRPEYVYQVPQTEFERRFRWLSERAVGGLKGVQESWKNDPEFRRLIRWAAASEDERLRRLAVTVIAAMEDDEAQSAVRALMFDSGVQPELKLHAAALLKLRGADWHSVLPAQTAQDETVLPEGEQVLEGLLVGERQLVRYADEVLEDVYGVSALPQLALMWSAYRARRGLRTDPIVHSAAASAALAYLYMDGSGRNVEMDELARTFGCSDRMLMFYACRIACILDPEKGETKDEDP